MDPALPPNHLSELPFITQALPDEAAWLAAFDRREIPVLADTAGEIEDLRANEDAVDAHLLSENLALDPLMTLKLLRHVALRRRGRQLHDAETLTEALVMLGITPFFRDFGPQPTVEQRLADHPEALAGLRAVLARADRAARFALAFAIHRQDHDAALIHEATLLHDFAEMLLWVHAPGLALAVQRRLSSEAGLRTAEAQHAVLGLALSDLQQALMKAWRLPELLVQISNDQDSPLTQVRNVQLAIRLARHSAQGWDNPALPDDLAAIGTLLNLAPEHALNLVQDIDACDCAPPQDR
jgi:HD-like signal output (HDOD) protein